MEPKFSFEGEQEKAEFNVDQVVEQAKQFKNPDVKIAFVAAVYYENYRPGVFFDLLKKDGELARVITILAANPRGETIEEILANMPDEIPSDVLDENREKEWNKLFDLYKQRGLTALFKFIDETRVEKKEDQRNFAGIFAYEHTYVDGKLNVSIHVGKSEAIQDKGSNFSLEKSLESLVDVLVERKLYPNEITAESWLMDHEALRKRMGFEKISEKKHENHEPTLSSQLWGQLIDKNGDIKESEVAYLFEHKEPRYHNVLAAISIEELFKRYGKKYYGQELEFEDRGKLEEQLTEYDAISDEVRNEVRESFDQLSFEEVKAAYTRLPYFSEFMETGKADVILNFLQKAKNNGWTFDELRERAKGEDLNIDKDFKKFRQDKMQHLIKKQIIKIPDYSN